MKKLFAPITMLIAVVMMAASCDKPTPQPDPDPTIPDPYEDLSFTKPLPAAFTKQIVDGGFEDCWYKEQMSNEIYAEYQSSVFYTLNNLHAMMDVPAMMLTSSPITAEREMSDPHGGKCCMKLVTGELTDQSKGRLLIPGAIAPLDENFVDQFLNDENGINVKKPYTEKPTAFKGYFKYKPVNGDFGSFCVELYNGNEVIGRGYQRLDNEVTSWQSFNVPIEYTSTSTPTHISIIISSSGDYNFADLTNCHGEVGSTLWIDDIEFDF